MTRFKLLCFAAEPWGDIAKRNQCLMREVSRSEVVSSLLYVNPPVFSSISDVLKGRFVPGHLGQDKHLHWDALRGRLTNPVTERIQTYTGSQKVLPLTRSKMVRRWRVLNRINMSIYCRLIRRFLKRLPGEELVVWLSHPFHAFALEAFPSRALLVYDWMDDWEQFEILPVENPEALRNPNHRILEQADAVFAVSRALLNKARVTNANAFLVPNATEYELFGPVAGGDHSIAPTMETIAPPRLGYSGSIGDRIDFPLLRHVAEAHPEWSIVMVGPVWPHKRELARRLGALPNVHFLGPQPYRTLPGFVHGFDVCIIPHTCDALTASMDPIKLYDYLASGKPIVSTRVAGVERFADVVHIADTPGQFVTCLQAALEEDERLAQRRLRSARENTWQKRSARVLEIIQARLEG